ncbi:hypothetical protein ABEB36_012612 [Hypothenemus hampei]|uniref:Odorant receptor n=1 Tax=Hypothenemus hampei TaxID=57062 RepID=A0ABD1EBV1_HYPHA
MSLLVVAVICQTFIMNIEKLMVVQQEFYLPLDFGGPRIKKTIIKAIQYEEIRCLITTLLIIVVIPCKINPNTLSERDHVAAILQKFCPKYEIIYLLIHTLFYLLSMPSVLAWHLVFMYFNWHVQFQVRTLIAHVENLCGYAGSLNYDECIADQLYQAYVRKQLKIVLKRHSEVIRYHRLTMQHLKVSITSLLLGLFGSFVCFMGFWIIRVYHTMDSISIVLAFLFAVDSLGYSAQEYQDQFLTVYDYALKVPWYQWDISNRKAYLLLIHKSSLMIPYPFFNTCVNRQFELELLKTIYSLGSIFINI